jgi:glycosyl transferase family 87
MTTVSWLSAKRIRAHGILLAATLWALYIWTMATPGLRDRNGNLKGTDFLHFYTLGSLAIEHRGADLYDINAQAKLTAQRVPEAAGIRYLPLYPPQVSLLFMPLAHLSYGRALALWWFFSAALYALCCYGVWRLCPNLKPHGITVVILAAGFPAFFHLIAWGQTSALALACFTTYFFLIRQRRDFLAGIALGCLIFKPQLGLAAAVLFVSIGAWKVILGGTLSALAELSIGVVYYGINPLRAWFHTLWNVRAVSTMLEPRPYQTHSLRTFWSMLIRWTTMSSALYVISAIVVIVWTIRVWKRSKSWAPRFSLLLLATVLVSPHLTVYDLVILAPVIFLLSDWLIGQPRTQHTNIMGTLLYLVYFLPLIGPLARWSHVQLSVVAMGAVAYLITKTVVSPGLQTIGTPASTEAAHS